MKRYSNDYFSNKSVLIFGGSFGTGFQLAKILAARRASVMMVSTPEEGVNASVQDLAALHSRVHIMKRPAGDPIGSETFFDGVFAQIGIPDVVIFAEDAKSAMYDGVFTRDEALDALGEKQKETLELLRRVVPEMIKKPWAKIVFLTGAVLWEPYKFLSSGAVSKALDKMRTQLKVDARRYNSLFMLAQASPLLPGKYDLEGYTVLFEKHPAWVKRMAVSAQRMAGLILAAIERDRRYVTTPGVSWQRMLQQRLAFSRISSWVNRTSTHPVTV